MKTCVSSSVTEAINLSNKFWQEVKVYCDVYFLFHTSSRAFQINGAQPGFYCASLPGPQDPWPISITGKSITCTKWKTKRERRAERLLWKEKCTRICNQASVFAISHSAPESILPLVMQHQQRDPNPRNTHRHYLALTEAEEAFLLFL